MRVYSEIQVYFGFKLILFFFHFKIRKNNLWNPSKLEKNIKKLKDSIIDQNEL